MTPRVTVYGAPWCSSCRLLAPRIEKMQSEFEGRVDFRYIDTEVDFASAQAANIQSLPVVLFERGETAIARIDARVPTLSELRRVIYQLLGA